MGRESITSDPEGLMAKGDRIRQIYTDYMDIKKKVDSTLQEVDNAWQDAASKQFISTAHGYDDIFIKFGLFIEDMGVKMVNKGADLAQARDTAASIAKGL